MLNVSEVQMLKFRMYVIQMVTVFCHFGKLQRSFWGSVSIVFHTQDGIEPGR